MQHFIYQTTNLQNGMIYIGVRSGSVEDNYIGSGRHLKAAIAKHGRDNFKRLVLQIFDTADDAYLKEAEIVDADFVVRIDTYNLKPGGKGGWRGLSGTKRLVNKNTGEVIRIPKSESSDGFFGNTKGLKYFNDGERTYRLNPNIDDTSHLQHGRHWKAAGRKWFNDGVESFFIEPQKAKNLKEGRLRATNDHMKGTGYFNDGIKNYRLKLSNPIIQKLTKGRLTIR